MCLKVNINKGVLHRLGKSPYTRKMNKQQVIVVDKNKNLYFQRNRHTADYYRWNLVYRNIIEVDYSLGQLKSSKFKDLEYTLKAQSFYTTLGRDENVSKNGRRQRRPDGRRRPVE